MIDYPEKYRVANTKDQILHWPREGNAIMLPMNF
jgi:hypothetical protein